MSDSIQTTKPQKPQKPTDNVKQNQQDPNKFSYNFVYKATIVLIFFVILPLFPSQAPDFINQNLLTRNWELLHLLFVGIAISYGLFSRRNQEHDKDNNNNNSKFDSAQTMVSRFLQVSSFFEDETDHQNQSAESDEIMKLQTWSNQNQHFRNKPMVVVAPQVKDSVFEDEQSGDSIEKIEKPLLLPVRSLKSRLSDDDSVVQSQSFDGLSKTGSKRFSSNSFNRVRNYSEFERVIANKMKEKEEEIEKENVVLASPIPWRSRSASARMMEPKQEAIEKASPMKFTPSESIAKDAEDSIKKKSFNYKSCFPPPPPPPPPPMFQKPIFLKSRYREKNGRNIAMKNSIEEGMNEKEDEDEEQNEYSTEKERFIEKRVIMETEDEETESEEDVGEQKQSEESCSKTEEPSCSYSVGDEGPDVDKKADEFIAKFREQIRLQRIESIKRSTRVVRNSSR
ncbi:uncharacterized protein LOC131606369 [Vicia villosa]|uniref:uncharacterized protein LOC131606369 n=1 Tax=Vicia villosa TaxID=3911 RepID=UPI00273A835D|nr:uncharacterized protein LOC131606369 [Vicia villosa]